METPSTRTYILERTWDFFVGQPNEPCSGAACLEPANSGAALLRFPASTAALRSPDCSGADPPASAMTRVDP
jgi:hypothetical protein